MSRYSIHINAGRPEIYIDFAVCLNAVGMEYRLRRFFFNQSGYFGKVVYRPRFVGNVHDGNKAHVWVKHIGKFFNIYTAVALNRGKFHIEAVVFKLQGTVVDGVVFALAHDDRLTFLFSHAEERGVIRFAATRREIQISLARS